MKTKKYKIIKKTPFKGIEVGMAFEESKPHFGNFIRLKTQGVRPDVETDLNFLPDEVEEVK